MSLTSENIDSTVYYFIGCVIISAIIIIFISKKASVYSYGTTTAMLFGLAFMIYSFSKNIEFTNAGSIRRILQIIEFGLPVIFLLLLSGWLFFMNIKYYKRIQSEFLSQDFIKYERFALGFFIIQIIILMEFISNLLNLQKNKNDTEKKIYSTKLRASLYLLSIFTAIFIAIMNVIIAFFVTDG